MAAAGSAPVCLDAAIALVLEELQDVSALKEQLMTALKAFLRAEDVLALLPTVFGKILI